MSLQTNSFVQIVRNIGRSLGVNKLVASYLVSGKGYEARYDDAFLAEIHDKDIVWDVGANIGYYTKKFVEKVGVDGAVFAFEPSPINFNNLTKACQSLETVTLRNFALGKEAGTLRFQQGDDDIGATSRIVPDNVEGVDIEVCSGAGLIKEFAFAIPNVIKIDVEGFELEVLEGMANYLNSREIRTIGVEIHFGLLKQRGLINAPGQIEAMLIEAGFKISWPDSSHLLAVRN